MLEKEIEYKANTKTIEGKITEQAERAYAEWLLDSPNGVYKRGGFDVVKRSLYPLLEEFLYEAIFQRDENKLLPRDVINQPSLKIYIEDFGKKDDLCLVAETNGKVIGAVWTRIIDAFGSVDSSTPEFAISLYRGYRGHGIGSDLMKKMLQELKEKGYSKTSLAVQKDNYALKMYQNVGFEIVRETSEEYIMVCNLK